MKTLLYILTFLTLTNFIFGQMNNEMIIEGRIIISFFKTSAKPVDSYVTIEGTNNKVKIDSAGYFELTDVKQGVNKLRIQLWGGALTKDTILTVHQNINDFLYFLNFDCDVNKYKAIYDIHYDKPKLLISGDIAPKVGVNMINLKKNMVWFITITVVFHPIIIVWLNTIK